MATAFPITNQTLVPLVTAYSLSRILSGQPVSSELLETAVEGVPMVTRDCFLRQVLSSSPYPEDRPSASSLLWNPKAMTAAAVHPFDYALPTKDRDPSIDDVLRKIASENRTHGRVFPSSLCTLGNAYLRAQRYDEALLSFRRALRIEPHPRSYTGLAVLYRQVDQLEDALIAIDRALRMEGGGHAKAFYEKGIILRRMGRLNESLVCFDQAIKLEKGNFASSYLERAITLRHLSRWQEALRDIDAALKLNGLRPQAHCERARVLRRMSRLQEALDSIKTALALDPMSAFALEERRRIEALFPTNR